MMKTLLPLLASSLIACWVSAIAILSVQNATPVALQFLFFQSIQMPVGVVLALSASVGAIGGAVLLSLGLFSNSQPLMGKEDEGDY